MWVKLKDGSLEWVIGFKVKADVLWGRLIHGAWTVLHRYATELSAQEALSGIAALAEKVGPVFIEIEAKNPLEDFELKAEEESEEG